MTDFYSAAHQQRSRLLAGIAGAAMLTVSAPAFAQQATPASGGETGEIVVTAQKRAENVQNVPVAVQVVGDAQLKASGVNNFADLSKVAPSLVVRPAEQPVNSSISIRGIGTFAFSIAVEPSVAVQLDDVPVSFQARAFTNLSDVERLEVLRGPQSTLYGKAASAGLINIVTKGPTKDLTGQIGAMATSDNEFQWNLGASGPITDTLGFRVTGNWTKFRGNAYNVFDKSHLNGREDLSLRAKLRWEPTDRIQVDGTLDYGDGSTTVGRPLIAIAPGARLRGVAAYDPSVFAPGIVASPDNTKVANNFGGGTDYHDFNQSLRASYDLDFASLMSITSHDKYGMKDRLDNDDGPILDYDNRQTGTIKASQWTEELRLVSAANQPLRYTGGLFFADVKSSQIRDRGQVFSLSHYTASSKSIQKAVFAQIEYDIIDKLTATGGIRYGGDKASYTFLDRQNGNAYFEGSDSRDYVTYRANLQYKFSPTFNVFGTFATGRKGQTYDLSTGFNKARADAGAVKPETSKDWEVGMRSQFFDRRLTFNVTAFTTDYKNFQAQSSELQQDGSSVFRLAAVGKLRTRGVEFEAVGRVSRALTIRASGAYIDAKIREFPGAACYPLQGPAQGCTAATSTRPSFQNLAGKRLSNAPKWKGTADFEYVQDLGDLPFQGVLGGAVSYQSSMNFSLTNDPLTIQKEYAIVNLNVGIRSPDQKWNATLFVNNITDKKYFNSIQNNSGNYNSTLVLASQLPRDFKRYVGVRMGYNF